MMPYTQNTKHRAQHTNHTTSYSLTTCIKLLLHTLTLTVAEVNWVPLKANSVAAPKQTNTLTFSAAQTKSLTPGALVYVAAFMTPPGAQFGDVPAGWDILEREFFLHASVCAAAPAAATVIVDPAATVAAR
jgi:hypothetical protein